MRRCPRSNFFKTALKSYPLRRKYLVYPHASGVAFVRIARSINNCFSASEELVLGTVTVARIDVGYPRCFVATKLVEPRRLRLQLPQRPIG